MPAAKPLPPGESKIEVRMVGPSKSTQPQTNRIKVDYHSRAKTRDLSAVGGRIMNAMLAAAQREDAIILSEQQPELRRSGVLKVGDTVTTRWLEMSDEEIIVIDKREATEEEQSMPNWGEDGWEKYVNAAG